MHGPLLNAVMEDVPSPVNVCRSVLRGDIRGWDEKQHKEVSLSGSTYLQSASPAALAQVHSARQA